MRIPTVLGHWLVIAQVDHNFNANVVGNPEEQQLELSVSYIALSRRSGQCISKVTTFDFKIQYTFESLKQNQQWSLTARLELYPLWSLTTKLELYPL